MEHLLSEASQRSELLRIALLGELGLETLDAQHERALVYLTSRPADAADPRRE
jgi:hypothetical protein